MRNTLVWYGGCGLPLVHLPAEDTVLACTLAYQPYQRTSTITAHKNIPFNLFYKN